MPDGSAIYYASTMLQFISAVYILVTAANSTCIESRGTCIVHFIGLQSYCASKFHLLSIKLEEGLFTLVIVILSSFNNQRNSVRPFDIFIIFHVILYGTDT